jgi:uncharacterized protein
MPEYLAPGVYVEEVSFRSPSIEGVPTSTTGFAGMTRTGPVQYTNGPSTTEPRLITSYVEFERVYGGMEPLFQAGSERLNYMAYAAHAFFLNGGKRLYVSRVYAPRDGTGVAELAVTVGTKSARWAARWPGAFGKVAVDVRATRSKNLAFTFASSDTVRAAWGVQARQAKDGAVVEILDQPFPAPIPTGNDPLDTSKLWVVRVDADGRQRFWQGATEKTMSDLDTVLIQLVELRVAVTVNSERVDSYEALGADPAQKRYIGKILQRDNPEDENAVVWLDFTPVSPADAQAQAEPALLMARLQGAPIKRLDSGTDGTTVTADDLLGKEAAPDVPDVKATGLEALGELDDIAIVALPDQGTFGNDLEDQAAADRLIGHAEKYRYRIAVVNGPQGASMTHIRQFRGKFDSKYAALYHPWIEILDPLERPSQGAPPRLIRVPPCGFVTGIYARSDIQRGVHKAPANEIVLGLSKFEANINKARQDVLNPEGINALRLFEGRGSRVWGARTMSSDPEWKYVNVRRLFIYVEHSIDKGTQFAVFEPNNERLWTNIRHAVEDFLLVLWRDGALLGSKPEEAFFVRCDRTTMTQNDIDNGRMICLVGIAPTKPAEFVIFRIGQFTADANKN